MSEPDGPEYVWAFPPEKRRGGRGWVIGVVVVIALAVAVGLFLLFTRPTTPGPDATASARPSVEASASASATPSSEPSAAPTPLPSAATPPPPAQPDLEVFQAKVTPVLNDARTGLEMLSPTTEPDSVQIVEQLQGDAQRLSDATPPTAIAQQWQEAVSAYLRALGELHSAYDRDAGVSTALTTARSALTSLAEVAGV